MEINLWASGWSQKIILDETRDSLICDNDQQKGKSTKIEIHLPTSDT